MTTATTLPATPTYLAALRRVGKAAADGTTTVRASGALTDGSPTRGAGGVVTVAPDGTVAVEHTSGTTVARVRLGTVGANGYRRLADAAGAALAA